MKAYVRYRKSLLLLYVPVFIHDVKKPEAAQKDKVVFGV